jgi:hypothetical protein
MIETLLAPPPSVSPEVERYRRVWRRVLAQGASDLLSPPHAAMAVRWFLDDARVLLVFAGFPVPAERVMREAVVRRVSAMLVVRRASPSVRTAVERVLAQRGLQIIPRERLPQRDLLAAIQRAQQEDAGGRRYPGEPRRRLVRLLTRHDREAAEAALRDEDAEL